MLMALGQVPEMLESLRYEISNNEAWTDGISVQCASQGGWLVGFSRTWWGGKECLVQEILQYE